MTGILAAACLTGCSGINRDTKIVLTTGFTKDEVFRIETASCYKKEVMVYLTNLQNQYEQVYGTEIWQREQAQSRFPLALFRLAVQFLKYHNTHL